MRSSTRRLLKTIGWREWLSLPELNVPHIKAKVDTGAQTSALHAVRVRIDRSGVTPWVEFDVHPFRSVDLVTVHCRAPLLETRKVRSSNGQIEERPVILTPLSVSGIIFDIELTLTNRAQMGFPMLLGREALKRRFLVDVASSFLLGRPEGVKETRKLKKQPTKRLTKKTK
ncbi:MAG: ATP-dependent zinc protease [Planctomycetes bacterium]|nr:ATP-dependent zinc protease [Planctomycetota bacterium]